ncbi:MAG: IgA Peptidase M64 [Bacteroidales bacterium]|nr:IgA Peptidase M64 [Bacteroidales bacterium]
MKRHEKSLLTAALALLLSLSAGASDNTLRLDYIFTGGCSDTGIALSRMSVTPGWYGRRVNMDRVPVAGNGDIRVVEDGSGRILYANSFSTLFQEWLTSDESKRMVKAFENTFLVPLPDSAATVTLRLFDARRKVIAEYSHRVDPADILIARRGVSGVGRRYIHRGGDPKDCIDVAILAEGYAAGELDSFYASAATSVGSIFSHEPFGSNRERFNFLAVGAESADSGVSVPRDGKWCQTAVGSNFDTFYIERYLTTDHIFDMHDILEGLPYEHIIILANTPVYGGGGIYNSYTLTTAEHGKFQPVVVHEFGHSFGALADEYDTDSYDDPYYFPDVEPWEENVTTRVDLKSKWQDMIDAGVPGVGLYEGAGYQAKGVWRPGADCRMRTNTATEFCPVCRRALGRMIDFNLVEQPGEPVF